MFFRKKVDATAFANDLAILYDRRSANVLFRIDNFLHEFSLDAHTYNPHASKIKTPVLRYMWMATLCEAAGHNLKDSIAKKFGEGVIVAMEKAADKLMIQPSDRSSLMDEIQSIFSGDREFLENGNLYNANDIAAETKIGDRQGIAYSFSRTAFRHCISHLCSEEDSENTIVGLLASDFVLTHKLGSDFMKKFRLV